MEPEPRNAAGGLRSLTSGFGFRASNSLKHVLFSSEPNDCCRPQAKPEGIAPDGRVLEMRKDGGITGWAPALSLQPSGPWKKWPFQCGLETCGHGSKPMGSHFGIGAPPVLVEFGDWDVHLGVRLGSKKRWLCMQKTKPPPPPPPHLLLNPL